MKTKICFLGFAVEEVAALRTEAGRLNALWECRFEPGAGSAGELLAGDSCDALVVNMSALGTGAVELLREAGRLRHDTLRFIVGDVEDQSLIINNIGGSHHFVRRPFEPADLVKNIQRGLKLDGWLSTAELRALVPRLSRLPSLPSTYFHLLKEVESPSATLQDIAHVIVRDPVATSRLLQTVNSAAFSPAEKVAHPRDAVALLGVQTVKSMVLCLQIFSQQDEARQAGLPLEILWEHSLLTAKFARLITAKQTADLRLADEAFTVGLLHDVGRIVMAINLPREYAAAVAAARAEARPLHDVETEQFGVNHAKVGAYLLGLWGLPAQYIEAAAAHHAPGQTAFAPEFSLLSAVHAANVFAHEMGGQLDGLPPPQLDLPYYQTLKLENQVALWRQACTGEPAPSAASQPVATPSAPPGTPAWIPANPETRPSGVTPLWVKPAAVLVVVLAGLLTWYLWPNPAPPVETNVAPAPSSPASNSSNPEATVVSTAVDTPKAVAPTKPVEPAPPAQPVSSPLDTVRVQGIFYRRTNPVAIVDKKSVSVGDVIDGVRVVAITQSTVTLSYGGEQRVYSVR